MSFADMALPVVICITVAGGFLKKIDVYAAFTLGAEDGLKTSIKIIPQLIGLLVAVHTFKASGAMRILYELIKPVADFLHFPKEIIPFSLLRPISGSGSLAMATDIFKTCGPDSFSGRVVSVMMGSTETTFYTVAVYFGAVGCKNTRHTLKCALFADVVSMFASVAICRVFF